MKLICPTDFSPIADNALEYALNLAHFFKSEIDLLHVYRETADQAVAKEQVLHAAAEDLEQIKKAKLQRHLDAFVSSTGTEILQKKVHLIAREGDPVEEISNYSKNLPFHLMVMGTTGESNDSKKSIGSITSEVIRSIYSPVMAIPGKARFKKIEKIVYAIDYDAYDKFTINSLAAFAGKFNAELIILHVNPVSNYFDSERWAIFKSTMNSSYDYENLRFEFLQNENVIKALNDYVIDNDVDIVAMLTRSYHLIDKTYKTSLTREMALHLNVPLLAFHD